MSDMSAMALFVIGILFLAALVCAFALGRWRRMKISRRYIDVENPSLIELQRIVRVLGDRHGWVVRISIEEEGFSWGEAEREAHTGAQEAHTFSDIVSETEMAALFQVAGAARTWRAGADFGDQVLLTALHELDRAQTGDEPDGEGVD